MNPIEALESIRTITDDFIDTKPVINIKDIRKGINRKAIRMIKHVFTLFEDANKEYQSDIVDFVTDLYFCYMDIMDNRVFMLKEHDDTSAKMEYLLYMNNRLRIKITDNEIFNDKSGFSIEIPSGRIAIVSNLDDGDFRFKIETTTAVIRDSDFNIIATRNFTTKMKDILKDVVDYLNIVE